MIVGFSTSSRQASVALLEPDGTILWAGRREAPQTASGTCIDLLTLALKESGRSLSAATLFAADLGPGSFTGVRVGVTLAKTLAYTIGAMAAGTDAFQLVDPATTVVVPSKRGEWFIRRPGQSAVRSESLPDEPFVGFGPGLADQTYPDAVRFSALLKELQPAPPEHLVPAYLIEPSTSLPKKAYGASVAG